MIDGKKTMAVLIRYAKNDTRGKTRSPVLTAQMDKGDPCPLGAMEEYVAAAGIKVCGRCNKTWGECFACEFCEPLFPTIMADKKGGKRPRPMPDPRVSKIVKAVMVTLATLQPDLLTIEEARRFSAKSLRCGGTSAAAAEAVRDGVLQGHGGWLSRASLIHYDNMMESERPLVSTTLNSAVVQELLPNRQASADGTARVAEGEPEELEEWEQAFEIKEVLGERLSRRGREFQVRWKPCAANDFCSTETTWEAESTLIEDGRVRMLSTFLRKQRSQLAARRKSAVGTGKLGV